MRSLERLASVWQDVRYLLRTLGANPAFAATAVLTLALGIGGNTAMFAIVRAVLLKPLAYREPDRLVQITGGATTVRYREILNSARSYSAIGASLNGAFDVTLSIGADPEVLKAASTSANFLDILGVTPIAGRAFRPQEQEPAQSNVALISAELWRGRFGGDPAILGKTLTIAAKPFVIVGVLPPAFQFPQAGVDVWFPIPSNYVEIYSPTVAIFGRLKRGVSAREATAELAVLNQRYRAAHPGMLDGKPNKVEVVTALRDRLVENVRFMLWMLFGAVGFVLLIACANIASLLVVRGAARTREMAVRAAVGASRWRLIRQMLAESVVLAVGGAAIGLLLVEFALRGIARKFALHLPRSGSIHLDGAVLGFALGLSIATAVLFGLIPALAASRPDLVGVLRASGRAAGSGSRWWNQRRMLGIGAQDVLVIGQVALSMVLLIGAALLIESLVRLYRVNPGFDTSHLLTMHISLPASRYKDGPRQAAFFDELARRVQTVPGIRGAAATFTLPLTIYPMTPVQLANEARLPLNQRLLAAVQSVTPAYFDTLGIPLRRGRGFSERDMAPTPLVAIINESLARALWPAYPAGFDPVGQRVLIGARADPFQVVGIVADMHQVLDKDPAPAVFRPFDQYPLLSAGFLVRTAGDPRQITHAVRDQVLSLDRDQPISQVQTVDDLIDTEAGERRLPLLLLACFAGAALVLAMIGIYGVIAYSVAQRTQELGVRRALGAQDADVLRMIVGRGFVLTGAGIAIGMSGALLLTRLLSSLLFHTSRLDPLTFAAVALLFLFAALGACYVPARSAARIDPMSALRV